MSLALADWEVAKLLRTGVIRSVAAPFDARAAELVRKAAWMRRWRKLNRERYLAMNRRDQAAWRRRKKNKAKL